MSDNFPERRWFWATLTLSSISIVGFVFAVWELLESHFFRNVDYLTLHYLYVSRGVVSSFLLAFWAGWFVLRERRASEQQLRQSRARYRGILNCSPAAIALFDSELVVAEWNAAAESLYGYTRAEVLGRKLPTIPAEKQAEMQRFLAQASEGKPVLDVETRRCAKPGTVVDVQTNVLPYREEEPGRYFLEVSIDIRERIRLRQTLLQVEKLTTMGQMAAGTAHHLNTPLASMLLRVELTRRHAQNARLHLDLGDLESNIRYCQQFVCRLLDFSRRPQLTRRAEAVKDTLQSVLSFLSPQLAAKQIHLTLDIDQVNGVAVMADRNQIEALFLILITNALDAVTPKGNIAIRCHNANHRVQISIEDDGCGIDAVNLPHVCEPFFTTKPVGKGTGLGLSIASTILQEHEGSIHIDSVPQQGTMVRIELPLSPTPVTSPEEVRA
ncbi:MAG TPA: ATP-binding protein [Terriglobales bacterium]|nr:ATP-binding protein [Terriglobales bacterium]